MSFPKLSAHWVGVPTEPTIKCNVEDCFARPPFKVHDEHGRFYLACRHHAEKAAGRFSTRYEGETECE